MNGLRPHRRRATSFLIGLFVVMGFAASTLAAKTVVDFNPNLDFSKYKTFAFVGGVENLLMFPVNPDLISERVHRAVSRELTTKGLREVQAGQNPDLLVRYWAIPSSQVNVITMGEWERTARLSDPIGNGSTTGFPPPARKRAA